MTRTRARADERNEKTDSVTKERRRIRNLETEVAELREEQEAVRLLLFGLLEDLADDMESGAGTIEWGEGVKRRTLHADDLLRIAELLDPDED